MSRTWAFVAGCAVGVAAAAQTPLLADDAFVLPPACSIDPFANPGPEEHELRLARGCGQDRLKVNVATPRLQDSHTGPGRVELEVDHVMTRQLDALTASARLGWSAGTQEGFDRLQKGQAVIAAGGLLKLGERWALDMNVGRDVGPELRTRASVAGVWRPRGEHTLFVQMAAEEAGLANAVGLRWWLRPGRAVFDLTARRSPDGQGLTPSVGLQVFGFAR